MAEIDGPAGPRGADSRTCRLSGDPVARRARHKIAVKVTRTTRHNRFDFQPSGMRMAGRDGAATVRTRNRRAANVATFPDDQPTPIAALHWDLAQRVLLKNKPLAGNKPTHKFRSQFSI